MEHPVCKAHENPKGRCQPCLEGVVETLRTRLRATEVLGNESIVLEETIEMLEEILPPD